MKYAALIEEKVTIPGDERSRTNPGHGYPEHTKTFTRLQEFGSEQEMLDWVRKEETHCFSKKTYRIIKFEPVEIKTTFSVEAEVKEDPE